MSEVISLKAHKKKLLKAKSRGLCQHGFHKWKINKEKQFDVKQGKLITVYQCERCGKQKVETM